MLFFLRKLLWPVSAPVLSTCCVLLLIQPAAMGQAPAGQSSVQADLQRAQSALRSGDTATAQRLLESVLKLDPSNAAAHADLGVMDFSHGDCASAEPHLRAALQANPALIRMKALLSVCEERLGQPSAKSDMESVFAQLKDPKLRARLGIELANFDYQRGDLDGAASVLHTLLDLEPNNVNLLFFAQRVYSDLANQTLNKLAVLAPGSARMEQLIAERLINHGDAKDAVPHYKKALQIDPRLPGVHFELAETLIQASPNDLVAQADALKNLRDAIRTDGDSANVECELGKIALSQDKTSEALADYRRAYRMDPHSAEAQMGIAGILERDGKDQQAVAYLQRAVAAEPFNAEAHYQLAQIDKKLHLDTEAQKQLKLFLDIRATKDKVKQVYREMNPQTTGPGSTTAQK